jgi:hypothetical protein
LSGAELGLIAKASIKLGEKGRSLILRRMQRPLISAA